MWRWGKKLAFLKEYDTISPINLLIYLLFMIAFKKSLYSALVFFGTLIVLTVGYAAWTTMGHVSSGNPLTATSWNALVDNIADLDSRWSRVGGNIAFTGGNVGIGTTNL